MKHIELISAIIEAEQQAQTMADEAKNKKLHLREDLRVETENLRGEYFRKAKERVETMQAQENTHTDKDIAALNKTHRNDMQAMENLYAANHTAWVDIIYAMVIDA